MLFRSPGIVREAYNSAQKKLSVLVSFDFMELVIPWLGFGSTTTDSTEGQESLYNDSTTRIKSEEDRNTTSK